MVLEWNNKPLHAEGTAWRFTLILTWAEKSLCPGERTARMIAPSTDSRKLDVGTHRWRKRPWHVDTDLQCLPSTQGTESAQQKRQGWGALACRWWPKSPGSGDPRKREEKRGQAGTEIDSNPSTPHCWFLYEKWGSLRITGFHFTFSNLANISSPTVYLTEVT